MADKVKQRFRVLAGIHSEGTREGTDANGDPALEPINYQANDPNNNVVESTRPLDRIFPNKFERIVEQAPPKAAVSDDRRAAVGAMVESGRWSEDDRDFLEQLPEDRFVKVGGSTFAGAAKIESMPLGEDVTAQFKGLPPDYKVWRNAAGKHQVTKGTDAAKPVNKDALDQAQVVKFAQDHSKGKA